MSPRQLLVARVHTLRRTNWLLYTRRIRRRCCTRTHTKHGFRRALHSSCCYCLLLLGPARCHRLLANWLPHAGLKFRSGSLWLLSLTKLVGASSQAARQSLPATPECPYPLRGGRRALPCRSVREQPREACRNEGAPQIRTCFDSLTNRYDGLASIRRPT